MVLFRLLFHRDHHQHHLNISTTTFMGVAVVYCRHIKHNQIESSPSRESESR